MVCGMVAMHASANEGYIQLKSLIVSCSISHLTKQHLLLYIRLLKEIQMKYDYIDYIIWFVLYIFYTNLSVAFVTLAMGCISCVFPVTARTHVLRSVV